VAFRGASALKYCTCWSVLGDVTGVGLVMVVTFAKEKEGTYQKKKGTTGKGSAPLIPAIR
jgi:hypothetical protein